MLTFIFIAVAAFLAGFIDAIVGGGGLVQLPALFVAFPGGGAELLGTNKISSIAGTSIAMANYARRVVLDRRKLIVFSTTAFVCALAGAGVATILPATVLKPVLLVLLIGVAIFTFLKKDFGRNVQPRKPSWQRDIAMWSVVGLIGFYDGFFGPGTGSFLMLGFISIYGCDFLQASAWSKFVNWSTNLAAICLFVVTGNYLLTWGLAMAVCNAAGAWCGSRLALRLGTTFVRRMFLTVVVALLIKMMYELWPR